MWKQKHYGLNSKAAVLYEVISVSSEGGWADFFPQVLHLLQTAGDCLTSADL